MSDSHLAGTHESVQRKLGASLDFTDLRSAFPESRRMHWHGRGLPSCPTESGSPLALEAVLAIGGSSRGFSRWSRPAPQTWLCIARETHQLKPSALVCCRISCHVIGVEHWGRTYPEGARGGLVVFLV